MEYGESYQPSPHLKEWAFAHQYQIEDVATLLEKHKAVVVEGNVHSGKTSLALAVNAKLAQEKSGQWSTCYTTPAVEENFSYPEVLDRTGVVYKKLPPVK
jgi:ABC-type polar amino acid transport system ATPase subunit